MIDFALAEDFWVCVFLAAVIHSPHDEVQRSWQRVFSQNMRLATGREQRLAEMRVCVCVCKQMETGEGKRGWCVWCLPWGGPPAGQPGSSPGPDGGGRSAWPPPEPGESPPAAASRWLPPPPGTPPWLGSATNQKKKS